MPPASHQLRESRTSRTPPLPPPASRTTALRKLLLPAQLEPTRTSPILLTCPIFNLPRAAITLSPCQRGWSRTGFVRPLQTFCPLASSISPRATICISLPSNLTLHNNLPFLSLNIASRSHHYKSLPVQLESNRLRHVAPQNFEPSPSINITSRDHQYNPPCKRNWSQTSCVRLSHLSHRPHLQSHVKRRLQTCTTFLPSAARAEPAFALPSTKSASLTSPPKPQPPLF